MQDADLSCRQGKGLNTDNAVTGLGRRFGLVLEFATIEKLERAPAMLKIVACVVENK